MMKCIPGFVLLILVSNLVAAQINGLTSICTGTSYTYTYDDGIVYLPGSWTATNGTITSQTTSGTLYTAVVQWSGAGTLSFKERSVTISTLPVSINTNTLNIFNVTSASGGGYCPGSPGASVSVSGSQAGVNYQFYLNGTVTSNSFTGNGAHFSQSNLTAGNWTVYASASGYCTGAWMNGTAVIFQHPTLGAPSVSNPNTCGPGTITATPGTNANTVRWYVASTGGTPVHTGTSSPIVSSNTTYYLSSYSTTTGCESQTARVPVSIIVNPLPGAPSSAGGNRCGVGTVTLSATPGPSGNAIRWYTSASGGSPLATALSYTTPSLSATTIYYISSYNGTTGCESTTRLAVTATVNSVPTAANFTGNTRFGAGSVTLTGTGTPSGGTYRWFNSSNVLQATGLTYTPPNNLNPGDVLTNVYNVRSYSAQGCESTTGTSITLKAFALPVVTPSTPGVVMGANVTLDAGSGYASYLWKNSANATVSTTQTHVTNVKDTYTLTVTREGATANTSFVLGSQLNGLNMNYIITNTILVDNITSASNIEALPVSSNNQTIQYFDGLGRPIQTVTTQGSPAMKDVVQPFVYDAFGREHRKYLPVVLNTNDGWFKHSLIDANGNYTGPAANTYASNPSGKIVQDSKPYSETIFEASPLNRVLEQGSPGLAWQPDASHSYTSTDRTIKKAYEFNTPDEVLLWTFTPQFSASFPFGKVNAGTATTPIYYPANQLTKNKTKDEQHNEVIEFVDKQGRTVLKKVQAGVGQYASTYYIYDDLGQLICVIPPEAVNRLATEYFQAGATDATKDAFLRRWAFRYRYDHRRRMSLKLVPGADSVRMVYDNRDRLVLTQDANQRTTNRWTFTKYDELNRPILTGIKDTTVNLTQAVMQSAVNTHFAKASARWGESYVGNAAGNVHGYTNRAYPVRTGTTTSEVDPNKYLTATYYDNYTFRSTWVGSYGYVNEGLSEPGQGITYTQPTAENTRVIGQVTGSKVKVLDGGPTGGFTWLKSITYYDDKYRVIQTIADNYKGGTDRVTNVVDFVGKVLESRMTHTEADFVWTSPVSIVASGNILRSTATTSGAASVQQLAAGQNGWIEAIYSENNTTRFFGLNDTNPDAASANIDYAFRFTTSGTVNVVENGTTKATITGVAAGDVFRITRTGTAVTYTRNGNLITLSPASTASSTLLMADLSLATVNATLVGLKSSFSTTTRTTTRRFEYDHAGRLLKTFHLVGTNPADEILLALNEYNELGQLVDKKLHSTVANGSNAKQSVDYRYNIRGWLTSMNNARLANEAATNDDANDLFGMELGYESTLNGLGNTGLFNGNISGMKYSSYGNGPIKEKGYTYTYDALNRIAGSVYKERTGTVLNTWDTPANNALAETGFTYDLNGNILNLTRNDRRPSGLMDQLAYTYTGNQLLRVTDAGDDFAGFLDGQPAAADDYTYDLNGNMTRDLNKGIGTSLTDATNLITYNFLNLPETVTKGTNSVRYIYDATGRKLTQVTTFGSQQKQTDYAGEFIYENDALQFINHEEGRIAVAATKMVYIHDGVNTTGITAATSTLAAVTLNAQTYIRATAVGTTARQGMFPIGGTITVAGGEQYRIRAKGYRAGSSAVHLLVRANATDINWPGATLLSGSVNEAWAEQIVTIPSGATTLQAGVVWNTVTAGEQFFLNDFEITKLETTTPEYQYHLKDHLGNVRLSFTSKDEVDEKKATLEASTVNADRAAFLKYDDARRVYSAMFDYTNGTSPGYAQRLSGTATEKLGLARSLALMPGDKLKVEVYAKYFQVSNTDAAAFNSWVAAFISGASVPASVLDGAGYTTNTGNSIPYTNALNKTGETGTAPMAYLNWIVYDKNFLPIPALSGYRRITTNAQQGAGADVGHEKLESPLIDITQPGYAYIWLSNENATPVEVYFDDFKVTHTKSPVIQAEEYYPFGLTFNSYQRENSAPNRWKFQSQEHIDDLGLNWDSFKWRNHQPDIGRFFNIDPLAEKYYYNSPYAFSENKVTAHVELEGLESWYAADGNVVHGPRSERNIKELGLRSVQGVSGHTGYIGVRTQQVRAEYNSRVSRLDPTDSKGRTQAKVDAREKLPALTREMSEKMRPIEGESSRAGGTANKTNAGVNSQAETLGKIGKISLGVSGAVSVYNVATAEDKGQAVVKEIGGLAGAIAGGEMGAEIGSVGGPWGAGIGGVVGSIVGSFVGGSVAEGSMSGPPSQSNYSQDGQHYIVPRDATNRIKIDKPIIRN